MANRAAALEARAATPLQFSWNSELPITAKRAEISAALAASPVVIVAGDTGSGKSTQLPQYCLEAGRGLSGMIAHTQPRRLAARALAQRIAAELKQPVGQSVGFKVRFADHTAAATRLVLLTDGLLLAELASDPLLRRYDTVIVDEAHERTLNVDLLLGVLKGLLPKRADLKVIVTSATLDVERIAAFFGGAPLIEVDGRAFPIEVRYRPPADAAEDPDLPAAVLAAVNEALGPQGVPAAGDVLVFLPGEREIRDVGELLRRELPQFEVLDLYSRLSWEEQSRIFERGARTRIVLATNVAETSITVPAIRTVIDSGFARVSRYSPRSRLQRLPIEPISQASAEQRKGRCGRVGPGVCLRLYEEAEFAARPRFTEPEVLRTNLAALLLKFAAEGLGRAEEFAFLDAPDARALNDGYRLLQELQALDAHRAITRIGRQMARLPLDVRLARALLESKRFRAESEVLALVAQLSVADFRMAGAAALPAAPEQPEPRPLEDSKSEFSALLKVWAAYRAARAGPRRELRRWCKERRFSLLRLSEWEDVYAQVCDRARDLGIVPHGTRASYSAVHRSLLAGFATMVGLRAEGGLYSGTRGISFALFPGSALARRRPRMVMAANIIETSRVFARQVAQIEPHWVEDAAGHLLKREYLEPDWSEEREEVVARERVSLFGLVLSANRIVNYGPIAPQESRRIFAREALVHGRLRRRWQWLIDNDAAILSAQRLEERLRSRDLLRGAEEWVDFYDARLPRQVSSAASLDHFARHLEPEQEQRLRLTEDEIFARKPGAEELAGFPEIAALDGARVEVRYRFAPGAADDGATLVLPLLAVPRLTRAHVAAAIPGFWQPRAEALLRSLPKNARRELIPIAATAARYLAETAEQRGFERSQVGRWLQERFGLAESLLQFDLSAVPAHWVPHLAVAGGLYASGASPGELRRACAAAARAELDQRAQLANGGSQPWRHFELEVLLDEAALDTGAGEVRVFKTLGGPGSALALRYEWSLAEAERQWRLAAPKLARTLLAAPLRTLTQSLAGNARLALAASPYLSSLELIDTLLSLSVRAACFGDSPPPPTRAAFEATLDAGRARLAASVEEVSGRAAQWFAEARAVRRALTEALEAGAAHLTVAAQESEAHLKRLLGGAALAAAPPDWLQQLPRYLKAEQRRWQRAGARGPKSAQLHAELSAWSSRYRSLEGAVSAELRFLPALEELYFWIEEYRVSLYAQELKTRGPVSAARLTERAAAIESWIVR